MDKTKNNYNVVYFSKGIIKNKINFWKLNMHCKNGIFGRWGVRPS